MSAVEAVEVPKQTGLTELTPSGSVSLPPKTTRIVVGDQTFEIEDSPVASAMLGKLQRTEGGSHQFPGEWNVHPTQFLVLLDQLCSTK